MTGAELIAWIKANKAEKMQVLMVEDGYAVFPVRPEVRENNELKKAYVSTNWLRNGEKSVVI